MSELERRTWSNPLASQSYDYMIRIGRIISDKAVLVGGWAVYLLLSQYDFLGLPSLDIDFMSFSWNYGEIDEVMREFGFSKAGYRYVKYFERTFTDELVEISEEKARKTPMFALEQLFVDFMFESQPFPDAFTHEYVEEVFSNNLYTIIEGIPVALREVVLAMKFMTIEGRDPEKLLKDLVDIYLLLIVPEEPLNTDLMRELYEIRKFETSWVKELLPNVEDFLRRSGWLNKPRFLDKISEIEEAIR